MTRESDANRKLIEVLTEARAAETCGDAARAAGLLQEALSLAPSDAVLWMRYGNALYETGEFEGARKALKKATELNPSSGVAWSRLGTVLMDTEQLEAAEAAVRKAISLKPAAHRWTLLALIQRRRGDDDGARDSLETALSLDPLFDEAMFNLAVLLRKEDPARALQLLEKAAQIDPTFAPAFREMGFILGRKGDTQGALQSLHKAIELNPADMWNHLYLAAIFEDLQRLDDVIACYERARDCAPRDAGVYRLWGEFHRRNGRLADAVATLRRAVELEPGDDDYTFRLGRALIESGNAEEGGRWLRATLREHPETKHRTELEVLLSGRQSSESDGGSGDGK